MKRMKESDQSLPLTWEDFDQAVAPAIAWLKEDLVPFYRLVGEDSVPFSMGTALQRPLSASPTVSRGLPLDHLAGPRV
jgi:hypothetical protein